MPQKPAVVIVMVLLALLTWASFERNSVWRTPLTLWEDVAAKNPGNARTYFNLACAYALQGRFPEALVLFNKAAERDPSYPGIFDRRGNTYDELGITEKAFEDYNRALSLNPEFGIAYYDRGLAYERQGRIDEARADYSHACARNIERACVALTMLPGNAGLVAPY